MKHQKLLTVLVSVIVIVSSISALFGIFSSDGPGKFVYESIRGEAVTIYGFGIYKHMSFEVAIQGIAQDIITLFIGIPALVISFFNAVKGSLKAQLIFSGVTFYFFVSYLMYQLMAMYNEFFLSYVLLTASAFFVLLLTLHPLNLKMVQYAFSEKAKTSFGGIFLILNGAAITLLWLSIVVPPLMDGTLYPDGVEHYTTLVVQAVDLSLLLPLSFLLGYLLYKQKPEGYVYGSVYLVFLSIMMTALLSKIIYMGLNGFQIIPVIFIIPILLAFSLTGAYLMLRDFKAQ